MRRWRSPDSGLAGCFGILLMLASPLFVVWAFHDIQPARERQAEAVTASAVITKVDRHRYRESANASLLYSYWYEFSVDGHAYRGVWNANTDDTHHVNEVVPISYLRSNPADNNYGGTLDPGHHSPAGDLVLAVIVFFVGLAFYKNWSD